MSAGWDKAVKVWSLTNCKLRNNLVGHQGYVNTVTVSPDGSLCASGGKVRASSLIGQPTAPCVACLSAVWCCRLRALHRKQAAHCFQTSRVPIRS